MSDGGVDIDELLKMRRNSENLFGIITDPKTGLRVSYPSIPKTSSSADNSNKNYSILSSSKKQISSLEDKGGCSKEISYIKNEEENEEFYENLFNESSEINEIGHKKYDCQNCEFAIKCKLEEEGFIELCPH